MSDSAMAKSEYADSVKTTKDLTGKRFGSLVVIARSEEKGKRNATLWECQCDCGNTCFKPTSELNSGFAKSCGCMKRGRPVVKEGERYGSLTTVRLVKKDGKNGYIWECRCDCGNLTQVPARLLRSGHTASCGCKRVKDPNDHLTRIDGTELSLARNISKPRSNTSSQTGVRGVRPTKDGYFVTSIRFKGQYYYLGTYKKLSDAISARKKAEIMVEEFVADYDEQLKQIKNEVKERT